MTHDEETVERVARAIYETASGPWEFASGYGKELLRREARAALSALPRAEAADEAALADLALDYLSVAQPEFCSARCPSVGREGVPIPHLSECESMRSLLTARVDSAKDAPRWKPIADPGAIVSTELLGKLTKLANYLTELGEYEAVDLIDTVVARLAAQAGER